MEIRNILNMNAASAGGCGGGGGDDLGYSVTGINDLATAIKNTKEQVVDPAIEKIFSTLDSMKGDGWTGPSYENFKNHLYAYKATIDKMLENMIAKATGFNNIADEASQTTTDVDAAINSAF